MTLETKKSPDQSRLQLARYVVVVLLCRLVLNTARRFTYPFAPALSRGIGVPLTSVTAMIAATQATAVIGIFIGPLADRLGYRLMMTVGLGMLVAGMFAGGFMPFYSVVFVALVLGSMGKTVFDPALQAYAGERVSYRNRGRAIGVLEMSWSGSALVGIPLMGYLIDGLNWRSPFIFLGITGLVGIGMIRTLIPGDNRKSDILSHKKDFWKSLQRLGKERVALGALGCAFFINCANDVLFVVYGVWLEEAFNLHVTALGLGIGLLGIAELTGEILTAVLADRVGLKRSVVAGVIFSIVGYMMLPLAANTLPMAMACLFVIFLVFEFTIVSFISLCTELMPASRATMMSGFFAAAGIGRVIGALIGIPLWMTGGILFTGCFAAGISIFGIVSILWGLNRWQKPATANKKGL